MKVFRSYEVMLSVGEKEQTWWLEERCGALLPAEKSHSAETLGEWSSDLASIGTKLSLKVYGDRDASRLTPVREDPVRRLVRLFDAVAHFRTGAMLLGLERFSFLKYASELEAEILANALTPDERMNLLTEACYSAWRPLKVSTRPLLAALTGIDKNISEPDLEKTVRAWYAETPSWTTRLAGFKFRSKNFLRYENGVEKSKVSVGDSCLLVREHFNEDDSEAVAVLHSSGEKLGYLRRTIARLLAPAIDDGKLFAAKVCVFLPQETPIDERIYLRVERIA